MHWNDYLGKIFLENGALTYMLEAPQDDQWGPSFAEKQKMDMVVLWPDHVDLIELKETDSERRKKVSFKQIERYLYINRDAKYKTEFWIYVYWKKYNVITGIKMAKIDNLQVHAVIENGDITYYASMGRDPELRTRRKVDVIYKVK